MIILSCDHAGYDFMQKLMQYFDNKKIEYKYMGPKTFDKEDDYPDFIAPASKEVIKSDKNCGIFVCGSGIGANIVANRQKGIRAVCAQDYTTAYLARKDEDANVLTIGSRLTSFRTALKIIKVFLTSEFEGGRHARRIAKY
ncbi:MAG: RpiB/LacA/LacB family sugar-phosphate isomerase [Clostridiales bacterium]|nr:RpiB/LacA/LacB family sugar-phosphate isomerase [Clostridiales bacterium]